MTARECNLWHLQVYSKVANCRVKNGYTRTRDVVPVPDPYPFVDYPTRPVPAGTGRVRVNPRVRVYPHTSKPDPIYHSPASNEPLETVLTLSEQAQQ